MKDRAGQTWPDMPKGVQDRSADVWEPLLAVAELAGGDWPQMARETAVTLVTASKAATPSLGLQLLGDIRATFDSRNADRLSTESLLTDLREIEEAPWAVIRRGEPLDARGLAQRLRKYDIKPDLQRIDEQVSRGYTRAQFTDAWSRYLPMESVTSVTAAMPALCGCGQKLLHPTSIQRGICEACRRAQIGAA